MRVAWAVLALGMVGSGAALADGLDCQANILYGDNPTVRDAITGESVTIVPEPYLPRTQVYGSYGFDLAGGGYELTPPPAPYVPPAEPYVPPAAPYQPAAPMPPTARRRCRRSRSGHGVQLRTGAGRRRQIRSCRPSVEPAVGRRMCWSDHASGFDGMGRRD